MKHKSDGFLGIGQVYSFTLKQALKKKGFLVTTLAFALLLFAGMIGLQLFLDYDKWKVSGEEDKPAITKVYFSNITDVPVEDFSLLGEMDKRYKELTVENTTLDKETLIKEWEKEEVTDVLYMELSSTEKKYMIKCYLPENSEIAKGDAEDLSDSMCALTEQCKLMNAPVSAEVLALAMAPVNSEVAKAGEAAESMEMMMVKMMVPMFAGLIIYLLVLIYGQSIGKEIIAEKSSKLMETLLLAVEPYGLIGGKILAMVSVAFFQILLWIASAFAGYFAGDAILSSMLPQKEHSLYQALKTIRDIAEGASFSVPAIILAVLTLLLGFVLFCILAGLLSSKASKAEDLSQYMTVFQMVVVVCFLVSYMLPIMQSEAAKSFATVMRYVPFTAAFMLPADVLVGNISIAGCLVSMLLLVALSVALVMWMADIYKKSVFYNGK